MARSKDTWLAHQRKRWMRPDAYRWFAPKHANFLPPHERKAGFNPDQPRDELGQWTETGAEDEVEDNEFGGELLDEFGGVRKRGTIGCLGKSFAISTCARRHVASLSTQPLARWQVRGMVTARNTSYTAERLANI